MAIPITPVPTVVSVPGEAIILQLRSVPGVTGEVILHITRNGNREERFTRQELTTVLQRASNLLAASTIGPKPIIPQ